MFSILPAASSCSSGLAGRRTRSQRTADWATTARCSSLMTDCSAASWCTWESRTQRTYRNVTVEHNARNSLQGPANHWRSCGWGPHGLTSPPGRTSRSKDPSWRCRSGSLSSGGRTGPEPLWSAAQMLLWELVREADKNLLISEANVSMKASTAFTVDLCFQNSLHTFIFLPVEVKAQMS